MATSNNGEMSLDEKALLDQVSADLGQNIAQTESAAVASPAAAVPSNDELGDIMSEIESLQTEIGQQGPAEAPVQETKAAPASNQKEIHEPKQESSAELDEFRGQSGEVSMEEALGAMKEEEPAANSVLAEVASASSAEEEVVYEEEPPKEIESQLTQVAEVTPEVKNEIPAASQVTEEKFAGEVSASQTQESLSDQNAIQSDFEVGEDTMADSEPVIQTQSTIAEPIPIKRAPQATQKSNAPISSGQGSLSMTLNGQMTLNLKYVQEDQEVSISFRDGFLCVELADGTEFKIPFQKSANSRLRQTG